MPAAKLMQPLEPPSLHHLSAALGWLELGNPAEALAELDRIESPWQDHADVLEARWMIHVERREWAAALESARLLTERAPERASGWLHRSYALRRVAGGGLEAAWQVLSAVADRFPKEPIVPFNLACYACQLGRREEALQWLQRALTAGGKDRIRPMALADPDLEPLWESIRNL